MITRLFKQFERTIQNNLQVIKSALQRQKPLLKKSITTIGQNGGLVRTLQRQVNEIAKLRLQIERHTSKFIPKPIRQDDSSDILKIVNIIAAFAKLNVHPKADNHVVYRLLYQKCYGRLYYISKDKENNGNEIPLEYKQDLKQKLKKNAASLGIDLSHCEDDWIAETVIFIAYRDHRMKYFPKSAPR